MKNDNNAVTKTILIYLIGLDNNCLMLIESDKNLFEGKIIWLKNKVKDIYFKINFNS